MEACSSEPEFERKRKAVEDIEIADAHLTTKGQKTNLVAHTPKGDLDILLQAINTARHTNEHATTLCQELLVHTIPKYYKGMQTGIDRGLVSALSQFRDSASILCALAKSIEFKAGSAPIYALPIEVLYMIFGHLDTDELLASRAVCPLWRNFLMSESAQEGLWRKALVTIKGTIGQTGAKWNYLKKLNPLPTLFKLHISDYKPQNWATAEGEVAYSWVTQVRPMSTLREFYFEAWHPWDECIWKLIRERCRDLKVLHWTVQLDSREWGEKIGKYRVGDKSSLGSCRLDELHLKAQLNIVIDSAFVQMLSQVKRLCLQGGLHSEHRIALLQTAREHIEELTILELGASDGWTGPAPDFKVSDLVLENLKQIALYDTNFGALSMMAPNVTSACFAGGSLIDWTLLDSCRTRIRNLQLLSDEEVDERLSQELFNMPRLETLFVEFRDKAKEVGLAALWNLVMTQSSGKEDITLQDVLPALKKITSIWDNNLSPEVILKFVDMRRHLEMSPIEIMQIHFGKDYSKEELSALNQLKHTMPGFSYTLYEDENSYSLDWDK